jgi:hypothetical protein
VKSGEEETRWRMNEYRRRMRNRKGNEDKADDGERRGKKTRVTRMRREK